MLPALLLLFITIPFLELYLLLELGRRVGALPTIALTIATGVLGAALARAQGFAALRRIQRDSASGQLPAGALLEGALILVAGVLLLTPGVLTDLTGLLLLFPPARALVARGLARWASGRLRVAHGPFPAGPFAGGPLPGGPLPGGRFPEGGARPGDVGAGAWGAAPAPWGPRQHGDVIDVEAEVRDVPERPQDDEAATSPERLSGR